MRILTWHDKNGDWLYDAEGKEGLAKAALAVLQERVDQGYLFFPDGAEEKAQEILFTQNGKAAFGFLLARTGERAATRGPQGVTVA